MSQPVLGVDVEAWARSWLESYTGVTTCTETPSAISGELLQVVRIGGGDDGVILDRAMLSVHAFAGNRPTAKHLAYVARNALFAARGVVHDGAVCARVSTIGGPHWTPYDNTALRRVTGTYQVSVKVAP
jgi:hypothetical protein